MGKMTETDVNDTVTVSRKKLAKLINNFYEVCELCYELDIYEHVSFDKSMHKKKKWTRKNFDRDGNVIVKKNSDE